MARRIRVWEPHERFQKLGKLRVSLHAHPMPTCFNVSDKDLNRSIIHNPHLKISFQWVLMRVIYLTSETVLNRKTGHMCRQPTILFYLNIFWGLSLNNMGWWEKLIYQIDLTPLYRICFKGSYYGLLLKPLSSKVVEVHSWLSKTQYKKQYNDKVWSFTWSF